MLKLCENDTVRVRHDPANGTYVFTVNECEVAVCEGVPGHVGLCRITQLFRKIGEGAFLPMREPEEIH